MQVRKFLRLPSCALALALSGPAIAADYTIDVSHSFIQFRISHLGYSVLNGRFNDFGGTLQWDKAAPAKSNIEVTIKTTSIDSNWAERDKHIRSKDFLEVDKYPEASFKSTKFTGDAKAGKLEGDLTLHGVTKPITLDVTFLKSSTLRATRCRKILRTSRSLTAHDSSACATKG